MPEIQNSLCVPDYDVVVGVWTQGWEETKVRKKEEVNRKCLTTM